MNCRSGKGSLRGDLAFWLDILEEHCTFIYNGLECRAVEEKEIAKKFEASYSHLKGKMKGENTREILHSSIKLTEELLSFKKELLHLLTTCKLNRHGGNLQPALVQHMINEVYEFFRIIKYWIKDSCTISEYMNVEAFWTKDMAEHSATIRDSLDPSEKHLKHKAQEWVNVMTAYQGRALTLEEACQSRPCELRKVEELASEICKSAKMLKTFDTEVAGRLSHCKTLGFLSPELVSHMAKETQYFANITC